MQQTTKLIYARRHIILTKNMISKSMDICQRFSSFIEGFYEFHQENNKEAQALSNGLRFGACDGYFNVAMSFSASH